MHQYTYTYLGFLNKHSILARDIITKYLLCDINKSIGFCLLKLTSIIPLGNAEQQSLITKYFTNTVSEYKVGEYYSKLDTIFLFKDQQKTKWDYSNLIEYIDKLYASILFSDKSSLYSSPVINLIAQVDEIPTFIKPRTAYTVHEIDYIKVYGIYDVVSKL